MPPYIYAVEFADGRVQRNLDLLRVVLNPKTRRKAHLSLRGPYASALSDESIDVINNRLAVLAIEFIGMGRFKEPGQGTIFIECARSSRLREVWDKPGLPFRPHVTAFDGPNVEYADAIAKELFATGLAMSVSPTALRQYEIGLYDRSQSPRYVLNSNEAQLIGVSADKIELLSADQRIRLARNILSSI
jgi:hypothetical protein